MVFFMMLRASQRVLGATPRRVCWVPRHGACVGLHGSVSISCGKGVCLVSLVCLTPTPTRVHPNAPPKPPHCRWRITGRVEQEAAACFPADSTVHTDAGQVMH